MRADNADRVRARLISAAACQRSVDYRGSTGTVSIYYNPDHATTSGGCEYTKSERTSAVTSRRLRRPALRLHAGQQRRRSRTSSAPISTANTRSARTSTRARFTASIIRNLRRHLRRQRRPRRQFRDLQSVSRPVLDHRERQRRRHRPQFESDQCGYQRVQRNSWCAGRHEPWGDCECFRRRQRQRRQRQPGGRNRRRQFRFDHDIRPRPEVSAGGTTSIVGGLTAVNETGSSVSGSFSRRGSVSTTSGIGRRPGRQQRRVRSRIRTRWRPLAAGRRPPVGGLVGVLGGGRSRHVVRDRPCRQRRLGGRHRRLSRLYQRRSLGDQFLLGCADLWARD